MRDGPPPVEDQPAVGYVLKGFPRLTETFVAGEIHRLERAGLPIRLFVIKPPELEQAAHPHPVVRRILARPRYLPALTSLTSTPLRRWLVENLPRVWPALERTARRCPVRTVGAAAQALAQAVRARRSFWSAPRKVYLKEFLQAAALADELAATPEVRHLHAHFAHGATTVTWLASIMTGLPFSFTAHAHDLYSEPLNPGGLLRRKIRAARFVVTCTEANVHHLHRVEPEAEVHLVYHGLNPDFSAMLAGRRATRAVVGLRLLAVGRLVAKKGFDTFVDACAEIARRGVPFEAVIVGQDGPHGQVVRRRIEALGLGDRVLLAGGLSQADLLAEYRRASVFCLPCRILDDDRDGIPNVLAEAMACGLPVVSTPVSGIPELVTDGLDGLLVPPDDPVALADAVLEIRDDPDLARRLGAEAEVTVARRFDGDALIGPLAHLFRWALGTAGPGPAPAGDGREESAACRPS